MDGLKRLNRFNLVIVGEGGKRSLTRRLIGPVGGGKICSQQEYQSQGLTSTANGIIVVDVVPRLFRVLRRLGPGLKGELCSGTPAAAVWQVRAVPVLEEVSTVMYRF